MVRWRHKNLNTQHGDTDSDADKVVEYQYNNRFGRRRGLASGPINNPTNRVKRKNQKQNA